MSSINSRSHISADLCNVEELANLPNPGTPCGDQILSLRFHEAELAYTVQLDPQSPHDFTVLKVQMGMDVQCAM